MIIENVKSKIKNVLKYTKNVMNTILMAVFIVPHYTLEIHKSIAFYKIRIAKLIMKIVKILLKELTKRNAKQIFPQKNTINAFGILLTVYVKKFQNPAKIIFQLIFLTVIYK